MARSNAEQGYYDTAWEIASNTTSYDSGFRRFRRTLLDVNRDELVAIWDHLWDRAQRVNYFNTARGGNFVSPKRLGCNDRGNTIFVTYDVSFSDEDGNIHNQFIHIKTPLEGKIGTIRNNAHEALVRSLANREYFRGWDLASIEEQIQSIDVKQVKCLTGG